MCHDHGDLLLKHKWDPQIPQQQFEQMWTPNVVLVNPFSDQPRRINFERGRKLQSQIDHMLRNSFNSSGSVARFFQEFQRLQYQPECSQTCMQILQVCANKMNDFFVTAVSIIKPEDMLKPVVFDYRNVDKPLMSCLKLYNALEEILVSSKLMAADWNLGQLNRWLEVLCYDLTSGINEHRTCPLNLNPDKLILLFNQCYSLSTLAESEPLLQKHFPCLKDLVPTMETYVTKLQAKVKRGFVQSQSNPGFFLQICVEGLRLCQKGAAKIQGHIWEKFQQIGGLITLEFSDKINQLRQLLDLFFQEKYMSSNPNNWGLFISNCFKVSKWNLALEIFVDTYNRDECLSELVGQAMDVLRQIQEVAKHLLGHFRRIQKSRGRPHQGPIPSADDPDKVLTWVRKGFERMWQQIDIDNEERADRLRNEIKGYIGKQNYVELQRQLGEVKEVDPKEYSALCVVLSNSLIKDITSRNRRLESHPTEELHFQAIEAFINNFQRIQDLMVAHDHVSQECYQNHLEVLLANLCENVKECRQRILKNFQIDQVQMIKQESTLVHRLLKTISKVDSKGGQTLRREFQSSMKQMIRNKGRNCSYGQLKQIFGSTDEEVSSDSNSNQDSSRSNISTLTTDTPPDNQEIIKFIFNKLSTPESTEVGISQAYAIFETTAQQEIVKKWKNPPNGTTGC